jgi:hypothetical protein
VADAPVLRVAATTGAVSSVTDVVPAVVADAAGAVPSVVDFVVPRVAATTDVLVGVVDGSVSEVPLPLEAGSGLAVGALADQLGGVVATTGGSSSPSPSWRSWFAPSASLPWSGPGSLLWGPAVLGAVGHVRAAGVSAHAPAAGDAGDGPVAPVPVAPGPVLPGSVPERGAGGNGSHDVSAVIRSPWGGPGPDAAGYWQQGPERATSRSDRPLDRPG